MLVGCIGLHEGCIKFTFSHIDIEFGCQEGSFGCMGVAFGCICIILQHMLYIAGWLAGHGDPGIQSTCPSGANELIPRAHTYIQMAAARIQDTGNKMQGCILYARLQA